MLSNNSFWHKKNSSCGKKTSSCDKRISSWKKVAEGSTSHAILRTSYVKHNLLFFKLNYTIDQMIHKVFPLLYNNYSRKRWFSLMLFLRAWCRCFFVPNITKDLLMGRSRWNLSYGHLIKSDFFVRVMGNLRRNIENIMFLPIFWVYY